jgi:hypothetical protein
VRALARRALDSNYEVRISARIMLTDCDLIPEADFAAQVDQSVHTLRIWRSRGFGPPFLKIGKKVFYGKGARRWVLAQERDPAKKRKVDEDAGAMAEVSRHPHAKQKAVVIEPPRAKRRRAV